MFKVTWGCEISKVKFERVGDRSFSLLGDKVPKGQKVRKKCSGSLKCTDRRRFTPRGYILSILKEEVIYGQQCKRRWLHTEGGWMPGGGLIKGKLGPLSIAIAARKPRNLSSVVDLETAGCFHFYVA